MSRWVYCESMPLIHYDVSKMNSLFQKLLKKKTVVMVYGSIRIDALASQFHL